MGRNGSGALTITPKTLHKRLKEAGMLATVDEKRNTCTIRKALQNQQREVLHIRKSTLWGETEEDQMSEMSVLSGSDRESHDSQQGAVCMRTELQISSIKTDKSDKSDNGILQKREESECEALTK